MARVALAGADDTRAAGAYLLDRRHFNRRYAGAAIRDAGSWR